MVANNPGMQAPPHPGTYNNIIYMTDGQMIEKEFEVIDLLDNIPIGQALSIMDRTKSRLLDCHKVDAKKACLPTKKTIFKEDR